MKLKVLQGLKPDDFIISKTAQNAYHQKKPQPYTEIEG